MLIENINKVKEDQNYIKQAQSINQSVNTVLKVFSMQMRVEQMGKSKF